MPARREMATAADIARYIAWADRHGQPVGEWQFLKQLLQQRQLQSAVGVLGHQFLRPLFMELRRTETEEDFNEALGGQTAQNMLVRPMAKL